MTITSHRSSGCSRSGCSSRFRCSSCSSARRSSSSRRPRRSRSRSCRSACSLGWRASRCSRSRSSSSPPTSWARAACRRASINFIQTLVGHLPGGLGMTVVVTCVLFGAITGSSASTIVAVGGILYPALLKAGYPERFALGVVTELGAARHDHPAEQRDDRVRRGGERLDRRAVHVGDRRGRWCSPLVYCGVLLRLGEAGTGVPRSRARACASCGGRRAKWCGG